MPELGAVLDELEEASREPDSLIVVEVSNKGVRVFKLKERRTWIDARGRSVAAVGAITANDGSYEIKIAFESSVYDAGDTLFKEMLSELLEADEPYYKLPPLIHGLFERLHYPPSGYRLLEESYDNYMWAIIYYY